MEAGGLVNAFGNGITFPFVAIYLHNVRGFSLGTAGLVLATNGVFSLLASPVAGWLSDRVGGRITLAGALVLMAVGVGSLALAHEPWCFQGPTQGALVADLAPARLRGRYMALSTMSWEIGFVVGPAIGGFVLDRQPLALWPLAAGACLLAGVGALALERGVPRELRLTPA